MLANAFSKSIKLAYRGAFNSLLCSRICLRVKMWSEHERQGRKPACSCLMYSSSVSASLVRMILLKTLLVMGSRVTPLQLLPSPKSPFLGNLTISSVFHASGIVSLSHIFLNMHIKRRGVSVSSALSISAVTPSAPHAFPLLIALMAAFTSSIVGGSMQISKSSTAGGISATCSGFGLFRMLLKCSLQRASFSVSFERILSSMSFTGTLLFLKPFFNNLLILYRVFRSCLPAASSASSASLSTKFSVV